MDLLIETKQTKKSDTYSAKDIEVLEGLEPVRRRPGMYVGGTDEKALHHLVSEVLDNAMDEAVAGHASTIQLHIGEDGYVTVTDNGRGIPVDPHPKFPDKSALEVILTTLHSGGKFTQKAYETAGGLHGVGISVVNALSEHLIAEVWRNKKLWRQEYKQGNPITKLTHSANPSNESGTRISFKPDVEIFGDHIHFKLPTLYKMAKSKAYLHKGVRILWSCDASLASTQAPEKDEFHFPNGIADYLKDLSGDCQLLTIPFEGTVQFPGKEGRAEWSVVWIQSGDSLLHSYCNTILTPLGGTHESGFKSALLKGIRDFGQLVKNKKATKITGDDLFASAIGLLSVFIKDPQFQGQTKERLTSTHVSKLVENAVKDHFDHWLSRNMETSQLLLNSLISVVELREQQKSEREENRKSPTQRLRLPGKLADCSQRTPKGTEIFIVEGDAAGGSAKQARDRQTQAILPLKGKILNVANATFDKMKGNQEIQDLEKALGCGTRDKFDGEKLRYEKIIIMTDADVDGAHIASLLMTFFYKEMRPLIEQGHLYIVQPPLYRLSQGGNSFYVRTDEEKDHLLKTQFKSNAKVEISRFKGLGEMNAPQLKETAMHPKKRTLLQIHLEDLENKDLAELESFVEDLMGKKPENRYDFIQKNAQFVKEVDI
ncbi:MAG: DNA topoisomerase IV subunit B [Alphaproteobacteria bacterium]